MGVCIVLSHYERLNVFEACNPGTTWAPAHLFFHRIENRRVQLQNLSCSFDRFGFRVCIPLYLTKVDNLRILKFGKLGGKAGVVFGSERQKLFFDLIIYLKSIYECANLVQSDFLAAG